MSKAVSCFIVSIATPSASTSLASESSDTLSSLSISTLVAMNFSGGIPVNTNDWVNQNENYVTTVCVIFLTNFSHQVIQEITTINLQKTF